MNTTSSQRLMAGVLAGLFATAIALAILSLHNKVPFLSLLLGGFLSFPIFLSAFAFGTRSSFASLVTAGIAIGLTTNMITGMAFTLIFFVPAFYSAFLLGLAYTTTPRQTVNDATITHWYPLSSILFRATLCIALTTSLFILAWLYSDKSNGYAENFTSFIMNSLRQWQNFSPGDLETIQAIIYTNALMIIAIGLVFYSTLFFIANLYTSTLLGHKLKRMARPREDWPLQFRLPLTALVIYVASFIASFLDLGNEVNLVINIVNTAFTDMLLISGLAYLHAITRGIKLRIAILSLIYFLLFTLLLTPPILILILLMGLWSSIQYSRNPRGFS